MYAHWRAWAGGPTFLTASGGAASAAPMSAEPAETRSKASPSITPASPAACRGTHTFGGESPKVRCYTVM